MKEDERLDLVRYRLDRAHETYEEALLMYRESHWNACANRLYYACFYAVSALLIRHGLSSTKHSGVKALFNQHFVKTGKVNREKGKLFSQLFEDRQEADYVDFVLFDQETVEPWVLQVEKFIESLSRLASAGEQPGC